jgi:DNA-directed RNA polymerase subunit RPC12/RpoP
MAQKRILQCPTCELALDGDSAGYEKHFCPSCGTPYQEQEAEPVQETGEHGGSLAVCDRCSLKLELDADALAQDRTNFCPRCGNRYKKQGEDKPMRKAQDEKDEKEEKDDKKLPPFLQKKDKKDDKKEKAEETDSEQESDTEKAEEADGEAESDTEKAEEADGEAESDTEKAEEADGEEGEDMRKSVKVGDWAEADLDAEGNPCYKCPDCGEAYGIDDPSVEGEICPKCGEQIEPAPEMGEEAPADLDLIACPECGASYDFNKSQGVCPVAKCKHDLKPQATAYFRKSLQVFSGIYKSLRRIGLSHGEISKALGSIAVASNPKGATPAKSGKRAEQAQRPQPQGEDIAVAKQPKGANTQFVNKARKGSVLLKNLGIEFPEVADSGESMKKFKKPFHSEQPSDKGGTAEGTDKDMEHIGAKGVSDESSFGGFGAEFQAPAKQGTGKFAPPLNYGVQKSLGRLAETMDRIEKRQARLEKVVSESGKKSRIAKSVGDEAPSTEVVREEADRSFAQLLIGKNKPQA